MTIDGIDVITLEAPFREPFVMSSFVLERGSHAVVTVRTREGVTGTGAVAALPAITGETAAQIAAAVEFLRAGLLGLPLADLAELHARMNAALYGNPSAKAAIDFAVHDALGKALGVPVSALLGGSRRRAVRCTWIVGAKPLERTLAEVRAAHADGFRTFKLKVGRDDAADIERVRAVREAMGDAIAIRVDVNAGYTPERAARTFDALAASNLELIEQPLARNDLRGHRRLRDRLRVPIMLDESVSSAHDVIAIAEAEAADLIYIKPAKAGGLYPARAIADTAHAAGLDVVVGGNVELPAGCAANLHFAAARGLAYASDACVGIQMHRLEGAEPFERHGDEVVVPAGPGLGIGALTR